jgi:molybdopterin converting factor small subunit
MTRRIVVSLFGSLGKDKQEFEMELTGIISVQKLLEELGFDSGQVKLTMVNHRAVSGDAPVRPGDRVSLFPEEYAVFADWKDLMGKQLNPKRRS